MFIASRRKSPFCLSLNRELGWSDPDRLDGAGVSRRVPPLLSTVARAMGKAWKSELENSVFIGASVGAAFKSRNAKPGGNVRYFANGFDGTMIFAPVPEVVAAVRPEPAGLVGLSATTVFRSEINAVWAPACVVEAKMKLRILIAIANGITTRSSAKL
jgi:hypothetical protein